MSALGAVEQWLIELGYSKIKLSEIYRPKTYKITRIHIMLMNPDGRTVFIWDVAGTFGMDRDGHDLVIGWADTAHYMEAPIPPLHDPEFFTQLSNYFRL